MIQKQDALLKHCYLARCH